MFNSLAGPLREAIKLRLIDEFDVSRSAYGVS